MKTVLYCLFTAFAGGLLFNDAIYYYREEKYTMCGCSIMVTIIMIVLMIKTILV